MKKRQRASRSPEKGNEPVVPALPRDIVRYTLSRFVNVDVLKCLRLVCRLWAQDFFEPMMERTWVVVHPQYLVKDRLSKPWDADFATFVSLHAVNLLVKCMGVLEPARMPYFHRHDRISLSRVKRFAFHSNIAHYLPLDFEDIFQDGLEEVWFGFWYRDRLPSRFPASLRILSLGAECECDLTTTELPAGLRRLVLSRCYDHPLDYTAETGEYATVLPDGLETLEIGEQAEPPVPARLPSGLKTLVFHHGQSAGTWDAWTAAAARHEPGQVRVVQLDEYATRARYWPDY